MDAMQRRSRIGLGNQFAAGAKAAISIRPLRALTGLTQCEKKTPYRSSPNDCFANALTRLTHAMNGRTPPFSPIRALLGIGLHIPGTSDRAFRSDLSIHSNPPI
jgi:hypothetical protein